MTTEHGPLTAAQCNGMHGGKGTVQYRRALGPDVFSTAWAFVDHMVVPPGASVGP